jgi:hypothetical protein
MVASKKNVAVGVLGTKLKVKATSLLFGEEVVKTKVGWHRLKWDGVVEAPSSLEALEAQIEAEVIAKESARSLSSNIWNLKSFRADPHAPDSAWSRDQCRWFASDWKGHGLTDFEKIHLPGGEGGILVAVALRRDGSVKELLSLDEWANTHYFKLPEGFQFLN